MKDGLHPGIVPEVCPIGGIGAAVKGRVGRPGGWPWRPGWCMSAGKEEAMESLITILIVVGVFLICREFVTWYWKLNAITVLLTEIRDELRAQGGRKAA